MFAAIVAAASLSIPAKSATLQEIMASRYSRYSACMHRALGPMWWKAKGIDLGMNRWGISEPTASSIASAPKSVLNQDSTCRRMNEIQDEPRPHFANPEKAVPD